MRRPTAMPPAIPPTSPGETQVFVDPVVTVIVVAVGVKTLELLVIDLLHQ